VWDIISGNGGVKLSKNPNPVLHIATGTQAEIIKVNFIRALEIN
jgi:hypothetical protein